MDTYSLTLQTDASGAGAFHFTPHALGAGDFLVAGMFLTVCGLIVVGRRYLCNR